MTLKELVNKYNWPEIEKLHKAKMKFNNMTAEEKKRRSITIVL